MRRDETDGSSGDVRRRPIVVMWALLVLVFGLLVWSTVTRPSHSPQRNAAERESNARELLSGIRIRANAASSTLAASKGLVDYLPENDTRLVGVRIVQDLDLQVGIDTEQAVSFREAPSFCLIGPFSAPQDAGYESPCWGAPDIGELVAAQLPADDAGHVVFPAGREIVLQAPMHRGGLRCDYPPGRWLLVVEGDPVLDGAPIGTRRLAEFGFEVPWSPSDVLSFLPVKTVAYCGSANVVYRQQGEPQIASPSPLTR